MNKKNRSHIARAGALAISMTWSLFAAPALPLEGTVAETLNADRYTYLRVDTADGSCWVATTPADIQAGSSVKVSEGVIMKNFTSPVLGKTFDQIVFAETVDAEGAGMRPAKELPAGHPPVGGAARKAECPVNSKQTTPVDGMSGEIIETMDAGNYTYVKVQSEDKTIWAASDKFDAQVGQQVVIPDGTLMKNFKSPSLGRTFDEIYFVDRIIPASEGKGKDACCAKKHAGEEASSEENADEQSGDGDGYGEYAQTKAIEVETIPPPDGGVSVAEIYQRKQDFSGQEVIVRGKVVKFSEKIMEKNWVHLQDGSASGEEGDLTVTTQSTFEIGDVVTVRGTVALDQSIGPHYKYPVILEDAVIVGE